VIHQKNFLRPLFVVIYR